MKKRKATKPAFDNGDCADGPIDGNGEPVKPASARELDGYCPFFALQHWGEDYKQLTEFREWSLYGMEKAIVCELRWHPNGGNVQCKIIMASRSGAEAAYLAIQNFDLYQPST